jgi:hypothetical protein
MKPRYATFATVGVVLAAAGVLAFVQGEAPAAPPSVPSTPTVTAGDTSVLPSLPPNHPPIPSTVSPHGVHGGGSALVAEEAPAIAWTVPSGWQMSPNPNAMRIATYHPSPSTEVSVSRAGGTTEANIQRWIGQFDDAGKDTRAEMTVHGIKVDVVEVSGTYVGGGMAAGPAAERHTGWSLLGAVVETSGSHYFVKMLGPTEEVRAARASFDTLLGSIVPR